MFLPTSTWCSCTPGMASPSGSGATREMEFTPRGRQLVGGGGDAELPARPTLLIRVLLWKKGPLPQAATTDLAEPYVFLRRGEHRLQYLDDAQTHELPGEAED